MMITYLGFFEEKKECYENEDTQDVNDNEKATEATATTTTSTTATTAGNCIDSSFVENITSIPSKVQSIIEPAIQALIDSEKLKKKRIQMLWGIQLLKMNLFWTNRVFKK